MRKQVPMLDDSLSKAEFLSLIPAAFQSGNHVDRLIGSFFYSTSSCFLIICAIIGSTAMAFFIIGK